MKKAQESQDLRIGQVLEWDLALDGQNVTGNFKMSTRAWEHVPDGWRLTLTDTKTGKTVDLGPDSDQYVFEDSLGGSDSRTNRPSQPDLGPSTVKSSGSHRFKLRLHPETESGLITEFKANAKDKAISLAWSTSEDAAQSQFQVQKETDGKFTSVGTVEGAGKTSYRYNVENLDYGTHTFRLKKVAADGTALFSEEVTAAIELQDKFAFEGAGPNPFRQATRLDLAVKKTQTVTVELYDLLGRRIRTLHDGPVEAQTPTPVRIDGQGLASGTYFVRAEGENFSATKKIVLVR